MVCYLFVDIQAAPAGVYINDLPIKMHPTVVFVGYCLSYMHDPFSISASILLHFTRTDDDVGSAATCRVVIASGPTQAVPIAGLSL